MKLKITETQIKTQISDYLKLKGIFFFRPLQGLGSTPGVSDFIGIYTFPGQEGKGKGKFLAIEVKAEKGVLSTHQREFLRRVNEEGGVGFVARDVADVIERLGEDEAND